MENCGWMARRCRRGTLGGTVMIAPLSRWTGLVIFLPAWFQFSYLQARSNDDQPPRIVPLKHAHAHNDYEHKRPLLDALDHGFCSVEADVFLDGDALLVGH